MILFLQSVCRLAPLEQALFFCSGRSASPAEGDWEDVRDCLLFQADSGAGWPISSEMGDSIPPFHDSFTV